MQTRKPLFAFTHTPLKTIFTQVEKNFDAVVNKEYVVRGWIDTTRVQKKMMFIWIYDGSCSQTLQLVFNEKLDSKIRQEVEPFTHGGTTIEAKGIIIKSPAKGQLIEMTVSDCKILGKVVDTDTYLPCGKNIPIEVFRGVQHLRPKCKSYRSIYRIRSALMKFTHEFFHLMDFMHLDPNVITTSDAEGGCEVFTITELLSSGDIKTIPTLKDSTKIDFGKDFFQKQAYLTVSSQLQLEALCRMGPVYTTNTSFRSEHSKTKRHLASFTHVEAEIPFCNLDQLMDFCEDFVTYCFEKVLEECIDDLKELDKTIAKGVVDKLQSFLKEGFARITYDEAIELIHKHEKQIREKFGDELKELPVWGEDLGTLPERFLSENIFKKPLFVYNMPSVFKAFYMRQNKPYEVDGKMRQTCEGCDMLIPSLGELIGASTRIDDYDVLLEMMGKKNIPIDPLVWYLDLRKNASTKSAGFGLGFDRLVTICTSGWEAGSIKDSVPFPVSYQECDY